MNKRREMLEKIVASGKGDSFALYALALEYRTEERVDEAIATFETLRQNDPEYLPMYLMAGQILLERERSAEAKAWLESGVALATRQGNSKARSELLAAIES